MSRRRNAEPVKITFINTQYVETDATSFKSVVQRLTGKDSTVAIEPKPKAPTGRFKTRAETSTGGNGAVYSRGMSFKDLDRMIMELPPLDELHRLCSDGI
ncbi:hypothetical protein Vadar_034128 [Vaccinium darrowii]|uniref:Uncharacterized protein n=1 Tax=Vaccinium darrowii TaxID=229202 RepID=A0ACB7XW19_9ERIC|nr:hypothetical protein Vadar_034128 [Vaccinium darrowii]